KSFETHIEQRDVEASNEVKEEIEKIKNRIDELEEKIAELEEEQDTEEETETEETEAQTDEATTEESRTQLKGANETMEERQILHNVDGGTVEQRQAFIKVLQGKANAEERDLVQASVDGEGGYLVPSDVKTDINELKRSYKSAKELVDVIPTSTDNGSFVMEEGANLTELINFDEDNEGLTRQKHKFNNVVYTITKYGAITPVSNSFLQDEQGNFLSYLNRLFARKAIHTENKKIFAEAKQGKTAVQVDSIDGIKAELHKLDPTISENAVFAVNQTAFARLDQMKDKNGRGLLQPNPADATQMMVLGRPVHVFSDVELPNVADRGAMFIGDLNE